jgi:hypothetical protein
MIIVEIHGETEQSWHRRVSVVFSESIHARVRVWCAACRSGTRMQLNRIVTSAKIDLKERNTSDATLCKGVNHEMHRKCKTHAKRVCL